MWEYDAYHSSIITAGNGGTKPARAAFTLFYNQGTEKYELEQTLQPDDQMWIDVGKLIREHVPDKNGKTLPPDLSSGSYEIRDLTDIGAVSLFEGKVIYDKTYGHVAYGCANCCDYQHPFMAYYALDIPFRGTAQNGVTAYQLCLDMYVGVSSYFWNGWYTGNTGVSVGSTSSSTNGTIQDTQLRNCPSVLVNVNGTANVYPTISGPNTVWYFSNLTVSGYPTSIQLTSSGGSSTTWNITAGANKINVSSFTGSSINVLSSGAAFSSSVGDVKLTATTNGQTSSPFSITTRTPNQLVPGTITTSCNSTYGYLTTANYTIQDQLLASLPSAVPLNENWTTGQVIDYPGTNWIIPPPGFTTTTGPDFAHMADFMSGKNLQNSPNPVPTCDGNGTPVQHVGQEWRIGSLATGFGRRVQTDTVQQYKAYSAHLSIVSPAP